jgi:hypothetical protein
MCFSEFNVSNNLFTLMTQYVILRMKFKNSDQLVMNAARMKLESTKTGIMFFWSLPCSHVSGSLHTLAHGILVSY